MADAKPIRLISPEEYLQDELERATKYEFIAGEIYAMARASVNHERIAVNIVATFNNHLRDSGCEPFGSDMKLRIGDDFYYPDVLVDCQFDESEPYYTNTPVLLVEVISKSTRKMDEQTKRLRYINIATLQEYVVIEQDYVDVAVFRKSDQWRPTHYFLDEDVPFESIDLILPVSEIYRRVQNDDMQHFLEEQKAQ